MIDRDIHLARALLVEGNPLLRSVAMAQLRDAGVGHIETVARVREAREMIEREPFDIVVCNREFEGNDDSGQDLLDELRRENLLPHHTVFLMVTARASYHHVVEAAEAALDAMLLRPYPAALLHQRLQEARHRKRELADVLRALEAGQIETAFARAYKRFEERQPYAIYCGRLAAELLLGMRRPAEARRVFEGLARATPGAWARLGVARAQMAAGDAAAARQTLGSVLSEEPASADAHDLLGRLLVEQCDFEGALAEYRKAAELTPGCLLRAQHAGALAFYQGQGREARRALEHCLSLGVQSKLFDALSLLLIALLRFDEGDVAGVAAMHELLLQYRMRHPDSLRLQRLEQTALALVHMAGGADESARDTLRGLTAQAAEPHFDLEAANMLLALWARLPAAARPADEHGALVTRIGMRFCTSKAITEVLMAAARRHEPAAGLIRDCQARIGAVAEAAMSRALQGDPAGAARQLLEAGESSSNAKLLEMAGLLARRHRASVSDAEALSARAAAQLQRFGPALSHIAGIQRSGRSPAGLQVRGRQTQEPLHGTA